MQMEAGLDTGPALLTREVEIGAVLTEVGNTNCPNPDCGDGEVVNVQTTDHVFQNLARFTNPGSGGIDNIEICKDFPPPPGGEGCTPGYWKQPHHFDSWVGFSPGMQFSAVFDNAFPGMTLLQVLRQGGGGLKALGRHTVAALLNASNPAVAYDLTTGQVINLFNATYPGSKSDYNALKDFFEAFNEQGCPLN